jgi:hypothetical protein
MRSSRHYRNWGMMLAAAAVLLAASPAHAFYWTLRVMPTVINPADQGNPANPPTAEPIPFPPDTIVPQPPPIGPPDAPGTPEPATAVAGLIGLTLLGVRRALSWKK